MKKVLALTIIIAILACAFALPGHAAGNALVVAFEIAETDLPREAAFTVDVKLIPTGADISALRLYVLYDNACFTWNPAATTGDIAGTEWFAQAPGSGEKKYPASMPTADQGKYSIAVIQWCADPADALAPLFLAGAESLALTLGFGIKADAPYAEPGGKIFLSADYSFADTPWFYADILAIDVTEAQLTVQPIPPAPVMQTALTIEGHYIYGFPENLPQVGNPTCWSDSMLSEYFTATNDGVFRLVHPEGMPLTGTGTKLQLWNSSETRMYGEYTLIIFGDLDGNFVIDYDDWAALKTFYGPVDMENPFSFAADVNNDGVIDERDLGSVDNPDAVSLYNAARGAKPIPQTR